MDEELVVRTLECHFCKNRISITTVPDLIAFCDMIVLRSGEMDFYSIKEINLIISPDRR